jgi:hypothetical protein
MDKIKFYKKYKGIKMNKYVPLLERELEKTFKSRWEWICAALDLKEKIDNEEYKQEVRVMPMPEVILIMLFLLLVGFNLIAIKILGG